jgi:hypothetical protein
MGGDGQQHGGGIGSAREAVAAHNSLSAKSVLVGEKLIAMYSIST